MRTLELRRNKINPKDYIKRGAENSHFQELIKEDCILTENGEIKGIYLTLKFDSLPFIKALQRIQYNTGKRLRGLKSTSRIFGYHPRSVIRQDYCSATSLAYDSPEENALVSQYARIAEMHYQKLNPDLFAKHLEMAKSVLPDWKIGEVFTSGIINKNNYLKYHFDTGNFNDIFSAQFGFKYNMAGGYLCFPEFGIALEIGHNSLALFDGQGMLHGVTPLKPQSEDAFRYTIVYYSLKQMMKCLPPEEELKRIKDVKTRREFIRYKMPPEHEKFLRDRFGKQ